MNQSLIKDEGTRIRLQNRSRVNSIIIYTRATTHHVNVVDSEQKNTDDIPPTTRKNRPYLRQLKVVRSRSARLC
jgi:hypothetical protein